MSQPVFRSLRGSRRSRLRGDVVAGLTVRQDVRPVMARDIGQVRDVLRRTEGERLPLSAYPSVREAIEALSGRP